MSFWSDLTSYLFGCIIFSAFAYLTAKTVDKAVIDSITNGTIKMSEKLLTKKKKDKKNNDDSTQLRDKDLELAKEVEKQADIYKDQDNLEVLEKEEMPEEKKSKKGKIVGVADVKDVVVGEHTKGLAEQTIRNLQRLNLETIKEKGMHQAMVEARNQQQKPGSQIFKS